jgi:beta-barrel assembly-enhancing protease
MRSQIRLRERDARHKCRIAARAAIRATYNGAAMISMHCVRVALAAAVLAAAPLLQTTIARAAPPAPAPTGPTPAELALITAADRVEQSSKTSASRLIDAPVEQYLHGVLAKLAATRPEAKALSPRIYILKGEAPFVSGYPNGALYVSTGLLARMRDEAQLAGILAPELISVAGRFDYMAQESSRKRVLRNFLPDLLLITVTAGLGAGLAVDRDNKAASAEALKQEQQADADSIEMLRLAGFPPDATLIALKRIAATLGSENQAGTGALNNPARIKTRVDALEVALTQSPPTPTAVVSTAADPFEPHARRFTLMLAQDAIKSFQAPTAEAMLDRFDDEFGASGRSAFLRAELLRKTLPVEDGLIAKIRAYESASEFSDVPAEAFKEIGFLYRKVPDRAKSAEAFRKYLERNPNAVDAPIVKSYLEESTP